MQFISGDECVQKVVIGGCFHLTYCRNFGARYSRQCFGVRKRFTTFRVNCTRNPELSQPEVFAVERPQTVPQSNTVDPDMAPPLKTAVEVVEEAHIKGTKILDSKQS